MKIAITGPGAMGRLLASHLWQAKQSTVLIDHRPDRAERLDKHGITVVMDGETSPRTFRPTVSAYPEKAGIMDWIIVLVKSYHTADALPALKAMSDGDTMILSLQNGMGQEDILKREIPETRIALGVTAHGAAIYGDSVKHSGKGMTFIGPLKKGDPAGLAKCRKLAELLNSADWKTMAVEDIAPCRWKKLVANCAINALTAITGVKNGELVRDSKLEHVMLMAAREAHDTACAAGVNMDVSQDEILEFVKNICNNTAENRSSMLQDITSGRRTEIDFINMAITDRAAKLGLPVPVNETLSAIIKQMEDKKNSPG